MKYTCIIGNASTLPSILSTLQSSPRAATMKTSSKKMPDLFRPRKRRDPSGTLIVVGDSKRTTSICFLLSILSCEIKRVDDEVEAIFETKDDALAYLVVGPFRGKTIHEACKTLLKNSILNNIPVFAVISDRDRSKDERALYRLGVEAVFEFPRDRDELPRLVMESLHLPLRKTSGETAKNALHKKVKDRLAVEPGIFGKKLDILIAGGLVSVSGSLDAFWKLKYLERAIAEIPGIKGVIVSGVDLEVQQQTDKQLEEAIGTLLESSSSLDLRTMDVSVDDGEVLLKGSTDDAHELQRVEDLVSQMNGVTNVKITVVVSDKQTNRDKAISNSISKMYNSLFSRSKIETSVFGGIVVLRGRVSRLADAIEASKIAKKSVGVSKVVNKLKVSSKS